MNAIDVIILLLLLGGTLTGIRRGFVLQVATILGAIAALGVARQEYPDVRQALAQVASQSPWLTVIAYLLVFLVVWGAIILLARRVRWLVRAMLLGSLDRLGGAIIGLLQAIVVVGVLLYLGSHAPDHQLNTLIAHSSLAPPFVHAISHFNGITPHIPRSPALFTNNP